MPTSTSRPPSVSSQSPAAPRQSLFSRLKSPFGSKSRNFTDFEIQLDDPHRQYNPGELVSGTVVLKVLKKIRVTHLVIALHGYVQVYKTPNNPGDGYRTHVQTATPGKGGRAVGYYGNGFATLFEDERVLCGDGMLAEGVYNFNFELDFPVKQLPSSIDFERGTITYMLTATLTRNTTIAPTTTTDRRIYYIEDIDIGPLHEPKPRVISLEPKSGRSKVRQARRKLTNSENTTVDVDKNDSAQTTKSSTGEAREEMEVPQSPAPSDISFETLPSSTSGAASSGGANGTNSNGNSNTNGEGTKEKKEPREKKPITAKIELLKAGFLRGDSITVKVTVNHTKAIKSMHGVIVTLYRQARVDLHPALPVISTKDGKAKAEDYFPRSKTGLGGLSLSNAGSTHLFRKDLAQSFTPLLVDPRTLTTEVKASIRVPDEAFPTITSVPGAMITFKYLVEVVVDLQGKLQNIGRLLPNAGMMSVGPNGTLAETNGAMFSTWGSNILDTQIIRRDKSVVNCVFEVIVGTRDSERKKTVKPNKGKAAAIPEEQSNGQNDVVDVSAEQLYDENAQYDDGYDYNNNYPVDQHDHYYSQYDGYDYGYSPNEVDYPPAFPLPAAATADDSALTEKERIRRAETRLLPSQPPGVDSQASDPNVARPSAPVLADEAVNHLGVPNGYTRPHASSSASHHSYTSSPYTPTPGTVTAASYFSHSTSSPPPPMPAPAYSPPPPGSSVTPSDALSPTEDKMELERRRLQAERSAPPSASHSSWPLSPSGPSAPPGVPSAPSAPTAIQDAEEEHTATAPELHDLELDEGMQHLQLMNINMNTGAQSSAASGQGLLPAYEPARPGTSRRQPQEQASGQAQGGAREGAVREERPEP